MAHQRGHDGFGPANLGAEESGPAIGITMISATSQRTAPNIIPRATDGPGR
jgi:hypothetical protein